jgi:hypothetical protein
MFDPDTVTLNLSNAPRRDVATLPGNGYLVMGFLLDNPGAWITHCHIAWHASAGLAMEFVESPGEILVSTSDTNVFLESCSAWNSYSSVETYPQDDSGI